MNKSISPINFIGFKAPLHIYGDTFNGDKSIEEEDQKEVKLVLSKMTKRNSKYKSKEQLTAK